MSTQGIVIFIDKVKLFFSKLFRKDDKKMLNSPEKTIEIEKNESLKKIQNSTSSIDAMRKERENAKIKEDIISLVMKNPDVVDTLSEERLDELEKMCEVQIKEYDKIINELDQKYERLKAKLA